MRIALSQTQLLYFDRDANYAEAWQMAAQARDAAADIFVLPEMFATGFSTDTNKTAEPIQGRSASQLRKLASNMQMVVVGGLALKQDRGRPKNVALAVGRDGQDLALYAKIHQISLLGESLSYDPGRLPKLFVLGEWTVACFICYDLRFPELFRLVADQCNLIIVIACWPTARQIHWNLLLRARAVENLCYVAGVNSVGMCGELELGGGSVVIDPLGRTVASAGRRRKLVTADIDANYVSSVRSEMLFLGDRRPYLFPELAKGTPNFMTDMKSC